VGGGQDLWVFGYGSLMWRPDFPYVERARARLGGYHRAFCIASTHHRGSAARPGLVLGLDRGGACVGVAYRVAAGEAATVLHYLRQRELISGVYREAHLPIGLDDGTHRAVPALAYVVERCHPSYTGALPLATQVHYIRGARGVSGDNLDYLLSTVRHLIEIGIREPELERLAALSAPHAGRLMRGGTISPSSAPIRRAVRHLPLAARRMRRGDRMRFLYRVRLDGG
jgi:glutathione-specific gamma-glutamylcyclotransferase